jgi:hypothetical protein
MILILHRMVHATSQGEIFISGSTGSNIFSTMAGWIEDEFAMGCAIPIGENAFSLYWPGDLPVVLDNWGKQMNRLIQVKEFSQPIYSNSSEPIIIFKNLETATRLAPAELAPGLANLPSADRPRMGRLRLGVFDELRFGDESDKMNRVLHGRRIG